MIDEIVIKPNFNFEILFNANLYMTIFSKVSNLILVVFYIIFLFCILIIVSFDDESSTFLKQVLNTSHIYLFLLFPLIILFFIYYSSKKQLSNNYRLKEKFDFIFNEKYFQEKGETFDLKHYWDKILKIKERRNYFLIYHNKRKANIIPKNSFNKTQLADFKLLIKSIDIKSNLKP